MRRVPPPFILSMSKYSILVDLVLSGVAVSPELAAVAVAAAAPSVEPVCAGAAVFSRPVVAGELETLISAGLDAEFGV